MGDVVKFPDKGLINSPNWGKVNPIKNPKITRENIDDVICDVIFLLESSHEMIEEIAISTRNHEKRLEKFNNMSLWDRVFNWPFK